MDVSSAPFYACRANGLRQLPERKLQLFFRTKVLLCLSLWPIPTIHWAVNLFQSKVGVISRLEHVVDLEGSFVVKDTTSPQVAAPIGHHVKLASMYTLSHS